ncbi:uncharacterized protein K489DRAFT_394208 [Dissoconium aciculare CBS 342.82]|uniref:C3H1-type domain-containing protein n=1 Tax=Dissoconium aciculare CBS 342.82 TaxID=1314786 RepID=A0A6J3M723_9PEZI|nr:uncharacterized protein K489DRAFT_394208 [Dissoconium aciculare CBS 342.82]KAF1823683.1 hypothetical protein K489DRAFT_394208 [Dissoconium aciculare CBS 342.82]
MLGQIDTSDYLGRLEVFRKSDAERDALLQEVEQTADYNNEKDSRRLWQSKANTSQRLLDQHNKQSATSNFAVALIDGDGALFQDYLYKQGTNGGAEAAGLLHTEIQSHLQTIYPDGNVGDWNIVVQVFCNLQGLTAALLRAGIISNHTDLSEFGRSFGLARPLFNFIDVGTGKERADHKIRETLRLYLPISQCKHVLFAPCHDNGYLPVLESYRMDPAMKTRITLVETKPREPGYAKLGFGMISMPNVFRSDDIVVPTRSIVMPTVPKALATRPTPPSSIAHTANSEKSASSAPINNVTNGATGSWATVGKSGAATKTIDISSQKPQKNKYLLLNAYDERLDEPLPRPDPLAEARFADTVKQHGKNLCNAHHLSGHCPAGEWCDYAHLKKLTQGEMLVLKHKSRGRQCPKKLDCRDIDCTYGHNCKFAGNCHSPNCHFYGTHDIDMEPAQKLYDDGNLEWIASYLEKNRK